MLVPVLLQKLPEDIKLELTRKLEKPSTDETTSDDQWDLDHLLELLKGEVEARELCGSLQRIPQVQHQPYFQLEIRNHMQVVHFVVVLTQQQSVE